MVVSMRQTLRRLDHVAEEVPLVVQGLIQSRHHLAHVECHHLHLQICRHHLLIMTEVLLQVLRLMLGEMARCPQVVHRQVHRKDLLPRSTMPAFTQVECRIFLSRHQFKQASRQRLQAALAYPLGLEVQDIGQRQVCPTCPHHHLLADFPRLVQLRQVAACVVVAQPLG